MGININTMAPSRPFTVAAAPSRAAGAPAGAGGMAAVGGTSNGFSRLLGQAAGPDAAAANGMPQPPQRDAIAAPQPPDERADGSAAESTGSADSTDTASDDAAAPDAGPAPRRSGALPRSPAGRPRAVPPGPAGRPDGTVRANHSTCLDPGLELGLQAGNATDATTAKAGAAADALAATPGQSGAADPAALLARMAAMAASATADNAAAAGGSTPALPAEPGPQGPTPLPTARLARAGEGSGARDSSTVRATTPNAGMPAQGAVGVGDTPGNVAAETPASASAGAAAEASTGFAAVMAPWAGAAGSAAAAAGGTATSPASPAGGHLAATLGSADFAPQLGAQISTFVRNGIQHARLELNPAEMGPLTVQIRLDALSAQLAGQAALPVEVHLAAENAQTRHALEQSMPELAGSLREAGLTLSGGGVFEQPRQPQPGETRSGRGAGAVGARSDGAAPGSSTADALPGGAAQHMLRQRGVVDLVA